MKINERLKVSLRNAINANVLRLPSIEDENYALYLMDNIMFMLQVYRKKFYGVDEPEIRIHATTAEDSIISHMSGMPEFMNNEIYDCIKAGASTLYNGHCQQFGDDTEYLTNAGVHEFEYTKGYGSIVNVIASCSKLHTDENIDAVFEYLLYGESDQMMTAFKSPYFIGFLKDNFGKPAAKWLGDVESVFAYELLGESTTVTPKAFATLAGLTDRD